MIGGGHAGSDSGNPGGGGRVGALQPRGRVAGDGRQAHPPLRAPASRARAEPDSAGALASGDRALDAGLATAACGATTGPARGGAADDGGRAARAAVLRTAHARRARRPARASGGVGDRRGRGGHSAVRAGAHHNPYEQPHRDAGARGARPTDAAPLRRQLGAPAGCVADDGWGRTRVRLERRRDEARFR
jgi:hypothetical protein